MILKRNKHKCCMCEETATYYKKTHKEGDSLYYCDNCVPRNSVANMLNIDDWGEPTEGAKVMWWDESSCRKDLMKDGSLTRGKDSFYYEYLDAQNRRFVSKNYIHCPTGFPKKEKKYILHQIDIMSAYSESLPLLSKMEAQKVGTSITEILFDKNSYELKQEIPYNVFMSKLGDEFKKYKLTIAYKNNLQEFYKKIKNDLSKIKVVKNYALM